VRAGWLVFMFLWNGESSLPITIKKVPITPLRASEQASKQDAALNIMGKDDAIFHCWKIMSCGM